MRNLSGALPKGGEWECFLFKRFLFGGLLWGVNTVSPILSLWKELGEKDLSLCSDRRLSVAAQA
jgi:hypothetical protein